VLAAAAACTVLLWYSLPAPVPPSPMSASTPGASDTQAPDAGTAAVGDTSPAEPQASTPPSPQKKPLAQEPLPEPRPGQPRPNEKGQCPGPKQVPINGGCWLELLPMSPEECVANSYVLFKGRCFVPAQPPPKKPQPTSSPPEAR
jgi:hypothetical protein